MVTYNEEFLVQQTTAEYLETQLRRILCAPAASKPCDLERVLMG